MKRMLPILTIVAVMTACNSKTEPAAGNTNATLSADTSGFTEFKAWKAQNELMKSNPNATAIRTDAPAVTERTNATSTSHTPVRKSSNGPVVSESGSMTSESQNAAKRVEKKGWSKAAKGAAIGAGSGAVLGAVINKRNRVVGGVIGGVVGGGIGYGIGRSMDKKDGRY